MRVTGWNSFYDGWLAYLFGEPFDSATDGAWKEGWKMALETKEIGLLRVVFEVERQQGHIVVEKG